MRKKAEQRHDPAVLEMKGDFASIVGDDDIRGHRRPCSHGEPLSSQLRHRKMYLRHKHCLYGGQSVTFNHAEEWEGAFLTSTAGTADKTVTAATSIAATATTVTNKSCARAAAANDKPVGLDQVEQAAAGPDTSLSRWGPTRTNLSRRGRARTKLSMPWLVCMYPCLW